MTETAMTMAEIIQRAAARVATWSKAKQDYARRVTGRRPSN